MEQSPCGYASRPGALFSGQIRAQFTVRCSSRTLLACAKVRRKAGSFTEVLVNTVQIPEISRK